MKPVVLEKDEIRLSSSLDDYSFGKTNYFTMLSQQGYLSDGTNFEPWTFDKVNTFKDNDSESEQQEEKEIVYYCGKNPLGENAKPLLDFFEGDKDILFDAVFLVVKTMTSAAQNNIPIPIVGAGGIIVDDENDKVLFLPEEIYKYSTNLLPQEKYFNLHTGWINQTIEGIPAICYERALIVYKLLTTRFPYPALNEEERNADILDRNFLPIELNLQELDENFAKEIDNALMLNSTSIEIPGQRKKGIDSEGLKPNTYLDLNKLKEAWQISKNINFSEVEIAEKTTNYLKAKQTKVEAKRKFRRNMITMIIAGIIAILIVIFAFSSAHKQNTQLTAIGLTSTETIQGFFQGVNKKEIRMLNNFVIGNTPKKYVNEVTKIFMLEKQLLGFTKDGIYSNPCRWLFTAVDNDRFYKSRVFGITNLQIDGKNKELNVHISRIKDRPEPVTVENNKEINEYDKTSHIVEYYVLETNPETYELIIEQVKEEFELIYINSKWIISDISTNRSLVPVNTEEFKKDYFEKIIETQDVVEAVDSLNEKYKWLPSREAMITELENLN